MNKEDKVLLVFKDPAIRNKFRDHLRKQGYSKIWGFEKALEAVSEARFYQPNVVYIGNDYKDAPNIARTIKYKTDQKNTIIKVLNTENFYDKIRRLEETIFEEIIEEAESF